MNKTDVINKVAQKTGKPLEVCAAAMDALEAVSGNVLLRRFKGVKLDETEAVVEIAAKADIPEADCREILAAFEETFSDALSDKFRWFK